jgi:hypothetical protein
MFAAANPKPRIEDLGAFLTRSEGLLEDLYEMVSTALVMWGARAEDGQLPYLRTALESWGEERVWHPRAHRMNAEEIVAIVLVTRAFLHPDTQPEDALKHLFESENARTFIARLTA